ncbi:MAG: L-alanine-DL-glutamate epimerase, partial [Clostridia bacterium]|nr:L-alanine-DL-glutamate epimerase [Clostridia bacterium]
MRSVTVERTAVTLVREPLVRPFGFKGMQINELWQTVVKVSSGAYAAVCPSTQSVLWADADVFSMYTQDESNMLMHRTTCRALELINGRTFEGPDRLIKSLIPELREYADTITGTKVKET